MTEGTAREVRQLDAALRRLDCSTCAFMERKPMRGGGFAPQCMTVLGGDRAAPLTPIQSKVLRWIAADDRASSWEGPDPGDCPGHAAKGDDPVNPDRAQLAALGTLNDLDAGIRFTVRFLRAHGFDTCDSGDGSKAGTMEGALDVPHVFIRSTPETLIRDADRLRELVARIPHAEIQATYDPKIAGRGAAILALMMVCDADLLQPAAALGTPDSITAP